MKRLLRFGARGSVSALGPLESEIMDALWLRGGWSSAPEIMPRFASRCAYSTIKTVLNNLSVKGHVRKRAAGHVNEFSAVLTREAFEERLVADVVKPLVTHYRNPLLAHIVHQLDDEDGIAELERLLRERRGASRRG
ncbi:MAG: BlaI/MecI/CopY family transcriptional regulator [Candidatus Tyrphobacter sp.]